MLTTSQIAGFPAAEVEACIRTALAAQAADQAVLRPGGVTNSGAPRSWEPEIDSLVAIEIICAVEELLGVKLPATFSPKGGYDSVEACIDDLLSETKAAWIEITKEEQTNDR